MKIIHLLELAVFLVFCQSARIGWISLCDQLHPESSEEKNIPSIKHMHVESHEAFNEKTFQQAVATLTLAKASTVC